MDIEEKVYENRLRRWAKRLGIELHKSKARLFNINDQGGYQLTDENNRIVTGERMELTLEEIAKFLSNYEKELREKTYQK